MVFPSASGGKTMDPGKGVGDNIGVAVGDCVSVGVAVGCIGEGVNVAELVCDEELHPYKKTTNNKITDLIGKIVFPIFLIPFDLQKSNLQGSGFTQNQLYFVISLLIFSKFKDDNPFSYASYQYIPISQFLTS
jgi:hypothetical protein